jgi:hypothetical protein
VIQITSRNRSTPCPIQVPFLCTSKGRISAKNVSRTADQVAGEWRARTRRGSTKHYYYYYKSEMMQSERKARERLATNTSTHTKRMTVRSCGAELEQGSRREEEREFPDCEVYDVVLYWLLELLHDRSTRSPRGRENHMSVTTTRVY